MNKLLFIGVVAAFVIVALAVNAEPSLIILIIIFSSALSAILLLPQRVVQNEIKTFVSLIVDGILLTIVLACYIGLQDANELTSSILIGFGVMAILYLLRRHIFKPQSNNSWRAGQKKTTVLGSMSRWHISPNDGDIRTAIVRWKEPGPDGEFVFRGLDIPCPITETQFTKFIQVAQRRQTNALYGTGAPWWIEKGNGQFGRVKLNEVLSRNFFVYLRRPHMDATTYESCIWILILTDLIWRNGGQGTSGRLAWEKSPRWYVSEAERIWLILLEQVKPQSIIQKVFNNVTFLRRP